MNTLESLVATPECFKCGRCFYRKITLKEHEQFSCQSRLIFACPPCGLRFENGWYLDQHLIRHERHDQVPGSEQETNSKQHQCVYCNKSFYSSFTLSTHQLYSCGHLSHSPSSPKSSESEDDELTEISDDDGKLHIVEDSHGLDKGYGNNSRKNNKNKSNTNCNKSNSNNDNNNNNNNNATTTAAASNNYKDAMPNLKKQFERRNSNATTYQATVSARSDNEPNPDDVKRKHETLKVVLKMKSHSEESCKETPKVMQFKENFVRALCKNIPSDVDEEELVHKTFKMVSVLKKGHKHLKAGNAVFLLDPKSSTTRIVKVLKVTDGVFRGVSFEMTENKLSFARHSEILPLNSVFCHGEIEFPKGKRRKRDPNAARQLLMAFKLLPAFVNAMLTSPKVIDELKDTELNSVPKWMLCMDREGIEGQVSGNRDEKPRIRGAQSKEAAERHNRENDKTKNGREQKKKWRGSAKNNNNNNSNNKNNNSSNDNQVDDTRNTLNATKVSHTNNKNGKKTGDNTCTNNQAMPKKTFSGTSSKKKVAEQKDAIAKKSSAVTSEVRDSSNMSFSEEKQSSFSQVTKVCSKGQYVKVDKNPLNTDPLNAGNVIKTDRAPATLRAYPCRECGRCFVYPETRDCHENVICKGNKKNHEALNCARCNHDLENSEDYDLHTVMTCSPRQENVNANDCKPLVCKYCDKQFIQTSTLATHLDYCCTMKSGINKRQSSHDGLRNHQSSSCCR